VFSVGASKIWLNKVVGLGFLFLCGFFAMLLLLSGRGDKERELADVVGLIEDPR
jgi:hypothetical protein